MNDTGLNGYVYDFSVDYNATSDDDIEDIHLLKYSDIQIFKYLMKKNSIV